MCGLPPSQTIYETASFSPYSCTSFFQYSFVSKRGHEIAKATVNFVMTVRPSGIEQLIFHWTDFHEIWYLSIFKSLEKIQVPLKSKKASGWCA
jgi:hypothetical protein